MRLFVAIELPAQVRRELQMVEAELQRRSENGRFVSQRNFHITLHFIGETDRLADAVSAVHECVRGIRPFELHLGNYSSFDRGETRTSIVTVNGDFSELNALYESLQAKMADYGFKREHRRYTPHITLGRNVVHSDETGDILSRTPLKGAFTVSGITLFESVRGPRGMDYLPLHREKF